MAYNKTKNAEAAQKFLHQGKTAQAIAEYLVILKHEPKDQVTLMTVGDLYVRQGETFQALEYFERLAQIFLADGFVTKAIAIYKKIAKLAPEENRPVERLAELYIQQGVLSEARPIYLQLAEMHQRAGRHPQAAALLRKLHEAEPENLRVLTQMAEMLHASNQKAEAAAAHRLAAEQLHRRGDHAEAIKHANRALEVSPTDESTIMQKALSLSASGQRTEAVELLKSQPQLDGGGKVSEQLLDLYLEAGERELACDLTTKLFVGNPKHFAPAHRVATAFLEAGEPDRALLLLDVIREAMTDAGEHEALSQSLVRAAERLPKRIEPREWLVELYGRTSDSFRMSDALADLGSVCEGAGRYDRARQVYEQLLDREPENEAVRRKLESVKAHLGLAPGVGANPSSGPGSLENTGLSSEALSGASSVGSATRGQSGQPANAPLQMPPSQLSGAHSASRPSATASSTSASSASRGSGSKASDNGASNASNVAETLLDDETQQFVTQSLTDVDLFSSYGLTQKAIDLLEVVVQRAPRHTPSIERLLDLYLGAGNERRTAELASLLQEIYIQNGDPVSADRFAELRRRYERAAGLNSEQTSTASQAAVQEFAVPLVEAEPLPDEEALPDAKAILEPEALAAAGAVEATEDFAIVEPGVHEVDLSEEWAALAGILTDTPTVKETLPESAVTAVAAALPEVAESVQQPEPQPTLDSILDSAAGPTESAETVKDETIEIPPTPLENIPVLDSPEFALELEPYPETAEAVPALDSDGFLSSLSAELDAVLPGLLGPEVPAVAVFSDSQQTAPALTEAHAAETVSSQVSDEKSPELIGVSGSDVSNSTSAGATATPTPRAASQASAGPLGDVFDQFKADMGEVAAEDEDLETHYNLGIAYREMGLLEEAISEFQKVAKANQQGQPFRYSMQCCTLLGLAFMDKSQPGIAAMWYERALETPGLDQESILALRYDLGVAQELAGEMSAARKSFSQVYGMNIDYRDVAERLGALGKGS